MRGQGRPLDPTIRVSAKDKVRKGDKIYAQPEASDVHVFDTESGLRLSE